MAFTIKSKIATGIGIFFVLLLTVSTIAIYFINILSSKTENLLTSNYNTIRYCSEMSNSLSDIRNDTNALHIFEENLIAQEHNITEIGEGKKTQRLRVYFDQLKAGNQTDTLLHNIRKDIYSIYRLNQTALEKRNLSALNVAADARFWLTILATVIILISFTILLNFPGYIADPIKLLTGGIKEVAQKKYDKRIYIDSKDEFGEMAEAFNMMSEKLYEYEHSNISKLMFEKKRVETIINQMEDAVIGLDAEGRILFINHKAEGLFNLKEEVAVGKASTTVAAANDLLRTVLQKGGKQPLKIITDKKERYFFADSRIVSNNSERIGEVYTLKDVTTFKELDLSKTNLLATISHELKTPISAIKMSTQLMSDTRVGALNMEQQELVKNIDEDAGRLLRLTAELLNMTQLETGNIQLKLQRVAPLAIIDNAVQATHMQATQKNIAFDINCPANLAFVLADTDKTTWVMSNLLTNATRYSPEGSRVQLSAFATDDKVHFSVADKGTGIEEQYQGKIFERYFTVPDTEYKSGTGLGLAISKEFIEAQGGSIHVESKPGHGSTFTFVLPKA